MALHDIGEAMRLLHSQATLGDKVRTKDGVGKIVKIGGDGVVIDCNGVTTEHLLSNTSQPWIFEKHTFSEVNKRKHERAIDERVRSSEQRLQAQLDVLRAELALYRPATAPDAVSVSIGTNDRDDDLQESDLSSELDMSDGELFDV